MASTGRQLAIVLTPTQRIEELERQIEELRGLIVDLERKQRYPTFLDVNDLADMLRVKPRTVHEWVARRQIPYRKAGDRTVFLLADILKWTNRQHGGTLPAS
jgi:Helix-turn-helix domain